MTLCEINRAVEAELERRGVLDEKLYSVESYPPWNGPYARVHIRIEEWDRLGLVPMEVNAGQDGRDHLTSARFGIVEFVAIRGRQASEEGAGHANT